MPVVRVKKGDTLVLYGPASVLLVEGRASVLGCPLTPRSRLIVKSWRSRPIYAEKDFVADVAYGENGGYNIIEGDTVPEEWKALAEKASESPGRVCIYGGVDLGKTTLATLILNSMVKRLRLAVYVDLDLGQSSICPPTTIGYVSLKAPTFDVSYHRMERGEIVGYTSPTPLAEAHLRAVGKLVRAISKKYEDMAASIDLDGWVSGDKAIEHKRELIRILKPNYLTSIGEIPDEIREECEKLGAAYEVLPPPREVRRRDQSARRKLRELAYERFLRESVVRRIPMSWISFRTINDGADLRYAKRYIEAIIQGYAEESFEPIRQDAEKALGELAKNGVGVLSYLKNPEEAFVGIGLLIDLNAREGHIKILTPYRGAVKQVIIGAILLSIEGEEIYSNSKILTLSNIS
jgi:polynucleotide 5'-hydroxyl-kinase GRC3/NOL9